MLQTQQQVFQPAAPQPPVNGQRLSAATLPALTPRVAVVEVYDPEEQVLRLEVVRVAA